MDAVLFDLFGTLIPNLTPEALRGGLDDVAEVFDADPEAFYDEWRKGFRGRMEGTVRDGVDVFRPTLLALGLDPPEGDLVEAERRRAAFFLGQLAPKPDTLDTLDRLRDMGCGLALVSDCSSGTPALLDRTPLGTYFPIRAISADLRTRKPDPLMYHTACEGLGVDPASCLYVGDGNSEELPGAKRLGMTTIWVDNGDHQHWRERFVPDGDFTVRELGEIPEILERTREGRRQ